MSVPGMPSIQSMTSSESRVNSIRTCGTTTCALPRKLSWKRCWLRPSAAKSTSRASDLRSWCTSSMGWKRRASGSSASHHPARVSSSTRSASIAAATPGRRTFTATASPFGSSARCTCATEPAALGSMSKDWKASASGLPRSCTSCCSISPKGSGRARSCSRSRLAIHSGPSMSTREASSCLSFTKAGPRASSARRRRSGSGLAASPSSAFQPKATLPSSSTQCTPTERTRSCMPWRTSVRTISSSRGSARSRPREAMSTYIPMPSIAGAAAFCEGSSAIMQSVVRISPATDAAFCSPVRVTLHGSRIPMATMSPYSPVSAL
jgi:hypothetical protein